MRQRTNRTRRDAALGSLALFVLALLSPPAAAEIDAPGHREPPASQSALPGGLGPPTSEPTDVDRRTGWVQPSADQQRIVAALGATVRWNRFGTPQTLIRHDGADLASGYPGEPHRVARAFLARHHRLFAISARTVAALELLNAVPLRGAVDAGGRTVDARVVIFRQRVAGLPMAPDGLLTVGVVEDRVTYVASSAVGDAAPPAPARFTAADAWRAAAEDVDRQVPPDAVQPIDLPDRADRRVFLSVAGLDQVQQARRVVLALPNAELRTAYEVNVVDARGGRVLAVTSFVDARGGRVLAVTSFVDARSGRVLIRQSRIDHASDPQPPVSDVETRNNNTVVTSAWTGPDARQRGGGSDAAPVPGDPAFTDAWRRSACDPGGFAPGGNDVAAATERVFAEHDDLHDWTYRLGFTERAYNFQYENPPSRPRPIGVAAAGAHDPQIGLVQTAAPTGGYPTYVGRNNASQITLQDGVPGIASHYLFQPIAAQWYGPCVDGAFDVSVVAHEYGHALTNRMVGGPDSGLSSYHGKVMGEAWADLLAVERKLELAGGEVPAVGAYVSGNSSRGVRAYPIDASPLNVTNLGYDGVDPHADAAVWTSVNWALRSALVDTYDHEFPATDRALQRTCARGGVAITRCPGNRRWAQLMVDSLLLQLGQTSLLDGRDALLAADRMRFGGVHVEQIWRAFAERGLGERAGALGGSITEITPDFSAPEHAEGTLIFSARDFGDAAQPIDGTIIFVGPHAAGTTPVATANVDPDDEARRTAAGQLPGRLTLIPGRYALTWQAPGYGVRTARVEVAPATTSEVTLHARANLASAHRGASITAPGREPAALIDDAEDTGWTVRAPSGELAGIRATVALAGGRHWVRSIVVNAAPPPGDTATTAADRFAALRSFAVETCTRVSGVGCAPDAAGWRRIYSSPDNAFPGTAPRPMRPDLTRREFDVPDTRATHIRLIVRHNQCTGNPEFGGEQDADPLSSTDCVLTRSAAALGVTGLAVYDQDRDELPAPDPHHTWG